MLIKLFLFFILNIKLFVIVWCSEKNATGNEGQLIFAHVLFRHGDRTPVDPYPTDPWRDLKYWPTGWGQLTNTGKKQHYELGQWLRKRYTNLISKTYSRNEIFIRSTDVDRTLMSALADLSGLYPPTEKDIWNPDVNWQPIPVHTIPEVNDAILAAKKPCPAYDYALKKLKTSEEYTEINKKLKPIYNYLTKNSGKNVNTMTGCQYIYGCLKIEQLYNKTLPEWTSKVYPEPLATISARAFITNTYTPQLARLKFGPLLKEMLTRFQDKFNRNLDPDRKLWIYSAHDTTVSGFLNTLNLFELHNPPYTACVLVELRVINKEPFVSIFYKNTTAEPIAMNIPNCGQLCPLDEMFKIYEPVLPVNWESECRLSMLQMSYVDVEIKSTIGVAGISILLILSLLAIIIAVLLYKRHSNYHDDKWYYRIDG
uniref:acid phosphatase n=1 Tax=Corethrella appendiculata TaxID=1370023 RepID=U5EX31_9DIPT